MIDYEILLMRADLPEERQEEIRSGPVTRREGQAARRARTPGVAASWPTRSTRGGRHLPPALVQRRRRAARRDLARAQDRRRRDAPPATRRYKAGSTQARWAARHARMSPEPSTPRWRRSNAEHQQRRPRRQPDARSRAAAHTCRDGRTSTLPQRPRQAGRGWQDAAYFFDVTVWGRTENCAQYLSKAARSACRAS